MPRILLVALAAALLVLPATAEGRSGARLRGTVALKDLPNHHIAVRTARQAVVLHVLGSLARIDVGQRVELRGTTLRARGDGSRVLARNVTTVRARPLATSSTELAGSDDEIEAKGTLASVTPLEVVAGTRTVSCAVPTGVSLADFATGDFVEITCDLQGGAWVLRELEHEDGDEDEQEDVRGEENEGEREEDQDSSGPGSGNDDD
jgi:hypothetical protein